MPTTEPPGGSNGSERFDTPLPARFRLGDLLVDRPSRTVSKAGETIELPRLSWALLLALARRGSAVASQDELFAEVWPETFVGEEVLTQRIKLLRQSLGDDGKNPRYIKTIRGAGYRLDVAVEPVSDSESSGAAGSRWRWPAAALFVAALVAFAVLTRQDRDSVRAGAPVEGGAIAVAVLPFEDVSPPGEPTHFGLALHDEILSRLSRIAALRVSPRTSVLSFRPGEETVAEVAKRLRVDAVLEGSVRRSAGLIALTMRLLDGQDESLLWTGSFELPFSLENLLAIQREVADQVVEALEIERTDAERRATERLPTGSLEAYEAYLLGRYHTFLATPEDLERAIAFLENAVEQDPEFAEAWASLALAHSFMGTNYGLVPPKEAYGRAKEAVLRALALDGDLGAARSVYADILTWYDWEWAAAEREYRRARKAAPGSGLGYVLFLSVRLRHAEATALMEEYLGRWGDSPWVRVNAAWHFLNARLYERALAEAALAGDHNDVDAVTGSIHLARGAHAQALEAYERLLARLGPTPQTLSRLAAAHAAAGDRDRARELLTELLAQRERRYVSPAIIAVVYIRLGELDEGFAWLDRAVEDRNRDLIFLAVDHGYDAVREDPRFRKLARTVGLPEPGPATP